MEVSRSAEAGPGSAAGDDGIAVVVLTHNRAELLRQCVENVLQRTSGRDQEIVIWDNAPRIGRAPTSPRSPTRGSG